MTSTINISLSTSLNSPPANIKAGSDVVGAARRALRRWSDAANIQFNETSSNLDAVNPTGTPGDGVNLITVSSSPTNVSFTRDRLGRTRVIFDPNTGRIQESDLALNPTVQFSTDGTSGTYDLESTFVHEIGHLLGLDHSGVIGASMQPRQGLNFNGPSVTIRTLSDDDLAGIRSIYGPRVASPVGSIAGNVNAIGAHVWAENLFTGRVAGSSITDNNGSYRIDQLPPSDYRVIVEYLDEPVVAREISNSLPYIGSANQQPFRTAEGQTSVAAGTTSALNLNVSVTAPSFNPRILGLNNAMQGAPVQLAAGRTYRFSVGGSSLGSVPLTAAGFSVTSPFMSINPASFVRENPANFGITEPNYGIVSFDLTTVDTAKVGDYSLRLRSDSGETAYLSGALALDPYTDNVELNPLDNDNFFVRQQYFDFLFREPEPNGFASWLRVLNGCANNAPTCDRIIVTQSFFQSQEFQLKGFFVYRFYAVAFGRRPAYAEIIPDMQFVTGQTEQEVNSKRDAYTDAFVQRQAFRSVYDSLSPDAYVNRLIDMAQVSLPNRQQLIDELNSRAKTRAQALRAVVESQQVFDKEYNPAFVAIQYYGYLKRDPETAGYNGWLNYLNANRNDFRTMVLGFANSKEHRSRFGPQ